MYLSDIYPANLFFTGFSNKVKGNLIEVKNEYTTNK